MCARKTNFIKWTTEGDENEDNKAEYGVDSTSRTRRMNTRKKQKKKWIANGTPLHTLHKSHEEPWAMFTALLMESNPLGVLLEVLKRERERERETETERK